MFKINQSLIKRIADPISCAKKYKAEYIDHEISSPYSDAMLAGHYFEYRALGSRTRKGEIPVMKKLKNGNKSTAEKRIDLQVQTFKRVINEMGIKISRNDVTNEYGIYPDALFHGTQDFLADWQGEPLIGDLKLTQDINSTFGPVPWGVVHNEIAPNHYQVTRTEPMDFIQADAYMYLLYKITGVRWKFVYFIFDYKPNMQYKIVHVPYSREHEQLFLKRFDQTYRRLKAFQKAGYPAGPSFKKCEDCPLTCAHRAEIPDWMKEEQSIRSVA